MRGDRICDTWVERHGVDDDVAVGYQVPVRFRLTHGIDTQEVTVFVQGGKLHIFGSGWPLVVHRDATTTHVVIEAVEPAGPRIGVEHLLLDGEEEPAP